MAAYARTDVVEYRLIPRTKLQQPSIPNCPRRKWGGKGRKRGGERRREREKRRGKRKDSHSRIPSAEEGKITSVTNISLSI